MSAEDNQPVIHRLFDEFYYDMLGLLQQLGFIPTPK